MVARWEDPCAAPVCGQTVVEAVGLVRRYRQGDALVEAVRGVSLAVARGELVALVGPSGSGKSTLLHLLGAVDVPDAGHVTIAGVDVHAMSDDARTVFRRRTIGFVFQSFNLVPTLTVLENVALPLLLDGIRPRAAWERARSMLRSVGVDARAAHLPDRLSGGEAQRVGVARALVAAPAVVLADEPTGNLDSTNADAVLDLFGRAADSGTAVVVVTHDPRAAARAHRIARVVDGRIVCAREEAACRPLAC